MHWPVLLLIAAAAGAQPLVFGITGGAQRSTLDHSLAGAGWQDRIGPQAGIVVESRALPVRIELNYQQRGVTREVDWHYPDGSVVPEKNVALAEYVSVPVLARLGHRFGTVGVFVDAGPRLDLFINYTPCMFLSGPPLRAFAPVSAGCDAGLGLTFTVDHLTLGPEVRYSQALGGITLIAGQRLTPSALQLLVSVMVEPKGMPR